MAKEKKTIQVQVMKNYANFQLSNPNNSIGEKMGIITMIEKILLESNAYKGYMYLSLGSDNTPPKLGTEEWASRKYF